jgi:23S rRNA (pseudouridine1915-N3)-methyltransferase
MRLLLLAVGQRLPDWAEAAYQEYARRMPAECKLALKAIKAEPRQGGRSAAQCMSAEAKRIELALPKSCRVVALDEHGQRLSSVHMASRLADWQRDGRDVALLMGGADGLDASLKARADESWRLSDLTLPHALARVLLAESLYRAWTIHTGHPYHRD